MTNASLNHGITIALVVPCHCGCGESSDVSWDDFLEVFEVHARATVGFIVKVRNPRQKNLTDDVVGVYSARHGVDC